MSPGAGRDLRPSRAAAGAVTVEDVALPPPLPAPVSALSTLDRASCLSLLGTQRLGRVVFTHRALPAILPVNFLLDPAGVVLRIRPGSALATLADGAVVAFQTDSVDGATGSGWSVTVVGRAEEVTDPALRRRAEDQLVPWAGAPRDRVVVISLEQVTGRRLMAGPAPQ